MKQHLFIFLALSITVAIASPGIYKWVDKKGVTHYSETPPPHQKAKEVEVAPSPPKQVIEEAQQRLEKLRAQQRPREVLGTVVLGFAPTEGAFLPKPPIDLTLIIQSELGGQVTEYKIIDPSPGWELGEAGKLASTFQNFALSLRPGKYKLRALKVQSPSLLETSFSLPTGGPSFTVPDAECVYVGRIGFSFIRLPPGSYAEANDWVMRMAKERGKGLLSVYLPQGTLVLATYALDVPKESERTPRQGSTQLLAQARTKQCAIQIATF